VTDDPEWFAPKRYGIGAGTPIRWQGWGVTLAYVATVGAAAFRYHETPLVFVAILVPVTVVFLVVAARTTRGGWRWRWGEEE
jgi:hypothetical protein